MKEDQISTNRKTKEAVQEPQQKRKRKKGNPRG